jgi:hypothetical protein
LHARRTQEPAERSIQIDITIDDGDVQRFGVAHCNRKSAIDVAGDAG